MKCLIIFILAVVFTPCLSEDGIFSWMFSNYEHEKASKSQERIKGLDTSVAFSVKIPFELKSSDEKFLNEMEKLSSNEMTELNRCNHQVIIGLQSTCTDLSDEELSKIAVNLLNCQSAVENRRIFSCTRKMKIHECTKNMDQDTWNAYHIVSNRARAVCYQLRQEQFKAQTEMVVKQLITSAEKQTDSMSLLHVQQKRVAKGQNAIHGFVTNNIRELLKEKSIIASGQKELARTTLSIGEKLESAQKVLISQGNDQQQMHSQILLDLAQIQENARRVWNQLDESTTRILKIHNQTAFQYESLMDDLNRMNYSVHHLLEVIITMKGNFEDKFAWITSILGETDVSVSKMKSVVIHLLYLIVGMLASSFLQVPYIIRVLLVLLVPLNAIAEYHQNQSLPFSTLTAVLATCLFCNLILNVVMGFSWIRHKSPLLIERSASKDVLTVKNAQTTNTKRFMSAAKSVHDCFSDEEPSSPYKPRSSFRCHHFKNDTLKERDYENEGNPSTLLSQGHDLAKRSHSEIRRRQLFENIVDRFDVSSELTTDNSLNRSSKRKICCAVCKNGLPCRIQASNTSDLCHRHLAGSRDTTPVPQ